MFYLLLFLFSFLSPWFKFSSAFSSQLPTTKGIKRPGLKVIKCCAAPQYNAIAHSSSFFKIYSLCKYLSVSLNQCSSLHSLHKKCCPQYPKAQHTDYQGADAAHGMLCCSPRSRGLEMSSWNIFVSACPHCPADTSNRYSICTAAPEIFCYRLP